jgi:uncharacterized damage-inducible protein DinB
MMAQVEGRTAVKDLIATLYAYNSWATARILSCAGKLDATQLTAPTGFPHGSLRDLLLHMIRAEWIWRHSIQTGVRPQASLRAEDFPTVDKIVTRWKEEEQAMRDFLAGLTDADLAGEVTVTRGDGKLYTFALWKILMHVLLHGMQHRSEAAAILTSYGQSPGDLDFIHYVSG